MKHKMHDNNSVPLEKSLNIALIGNPNSGKTTLFNAITGANAQVGNWPGVTIDKKVGIFKIGNTKHSIIDLPGIYSLSPYSPEELVSRDYLLKDTPDVILNIVDSTNLERNLYLTTQLLELDIPVVVALNMTDSLKLDGIELDCNILSDMLGVPAIPISALKKNGIAPLTEAIFNCNKLRHGVSKLVAPISDIVSELIPSLHEYVDKHHEYYAVKLIENDSYTCKELPVSADKATELLSHIDSGIFDGDFSAMVADARYKYIETVSIKCLKRITPLGSLTKSQKIDKVLTNRIFGIPIFIGIMFLVFHLTFSENLLFLGAFIPEGSFSLPVIGEDAINSPGVMLSQLVAWGCDSITGAIGGALASSPAWVSGLINNGLLGGVFAVLTFIPQILVLFLFLSILNNSGYMARVGFLFDRILRKFGLSGRALIPLISCFGCAVPGIMATRTLENDKERRLTIMLSPFFSCGAKLPIWATFAAYMFGGKQGDLVVMSIYLIGIATAIAAALILKLTWLRTNNSAFIMEMPAYRMPQLKSVMLELWEKLKHYLTKAATIIAGSTLVIWFLTSFTFSWQYTADMGESILGQLSKMMQFIFIPLGFGQGAEGYKFVIAILSGLIAKEMVVATLGTLAGMGSSGEIAGIAPIAILIGSLSIPAAYAFMVFNLLTIPCMAAVASARGELKSKKAFRLTLLFWLAIAYVVALIVYWSGMYWWIGVTTAVLFAIAITLLIMRDKRLRKGEMLNKQLL